MRTAGGKPRHRLSLGEEKMPDLITSLEKHQKAFERGGSRPFIVYRDNKIADHWLREQANLDELGLDLRLERKSE